MGLFSDSFDEAPLYEELFKLGKSRNYSAGEIIYLQDSESIGLIGIKKGTIKNCVYFANGNERIICLFKGPCITGETAVVDCGTNLSTAVAVTDVEAVIIPKDKLVEHLSSNPKALNLFLKINAIKLRATHLQAESVALSIPQKLARMLINFKSYGNFSTDNDNMVHLTHELAAGFLGTTRPKITATLNSFEKAGLIKKGRGTIEILDAEGLRKMYS